MREPAQRHQEKLEEKKQIVQEYNKAWRENTDRYNLFRRMIYASTLNDTDRAVLAALQKPVLEFNIMQSYVARALGDYSQNEPSVNVMTDEGFPIDLQTIDLVGGYIRHTLNEAQKASELYRIYQDTLTGGFGAGIVYTDWVNNDSFDQCIKFKRVYDPTLCGWDLTAQAPHKGDGKYCFQHYPMKTEDVKKEWTHADLEHIRYKHKPGDFSWSYMADHQKYVLICEYFEKETRREKLLLLADGRKMREKNYRELISMWDRIEEPPVVVAERWTENTVITRDLFIENQLLQHEITNYDDLPIVFFDGNSINLRKTAQWNLGRTINVDIASSTSDSYQMTIPYPYYMVDVQRLKNFSGQTLANEMENLVQHKFMAALESLPPQQDYLEAWKDVQHASTLFYKSIDPSNPDRPLPPPATISRAPIPPEITQSFALCDQLAQNIMGSFEGSMAKMADQNMSGRALQTADLMSSAAMKPYLYNHMQSLTQVANIISGLIPKIHITPKTIPIIDEEGKRSYVPINQPGSNQLNYDSNALHIRVEAGVNSTIQKQAAIQQIIGMSQASPVFGQFINEMGLEILVDNMDIRGADVLKKMAPEYMQKIKQQQEMQQQAAQQAQQNNPMIMRAQNERMKIDQDGKIAMMESQMESQKLQLEQMKASIAMLQALSAHENARIEAAVKIDEHQTDKLKAAVELAAHVADMSHKHEKDARELEHAEIELLHEIEQASRQSQETMREITEE